MTIFDALAGVDAMQSAAQMVVDELTAQRDSARAEFDNLHPALIAACDANVVMARELSNNDRRMDAVMSAPEWEQGMGLSWSGKWHLIIRRDVDRGEGFLESWTQGACGTHVYRDGYLPNHLQAIKTGEKTAPVCKKCAKAKAAQ